MPDNDRFRRGLSARWRRVQRSIRAGDRPDQVADLVVKAAAADLRRSGGIAAVAERADLTQARPDTQWTDVILDEGSVSGRHEVTLLAAERLTHQWALTSPLSALESFADVMIAKLADDRFDRMMPELVGRGGLTATQLADLRDIVHRHPQMVMLRDRLVKHPDAVGLQAPRRMVHRRRIADLLNTEVTEL